MLAHGKSRIFVAQYSQNESLQRERDEKREKSFAKLIQLEFDPSVTLAVTTLR
tara:strand:+ start:591 stop:749 length:159 start_codon:yes stop_codon:yes gene_type:complete